MRFLYRREAAEQSILRYLLLMPARGRLGKYLIESDYETIRISSDKFDDENRTGDNKSLPF
ncbi:hypothetical protein D7W34_11730 [Escherichia coli]|nr:hypothetical protein CU077_13675 [Escherichia coli]EFO2218179.1 hypothetical protein [Escherichia coli O11]AWT01677.1 hypothetical protein BEN53_11615 [Escherichia coli]AZR88920.1 hypothetical protein DWB25_11270 [Escherichia coli]EAB9243276.1 hypothetical protein [Escherichia coli]